MPDISAVSYTHLDVYKRQILERDNMNRAYKRVKANKGAPGIDGMTIEAADVYKRQSYGFWFSLSSLCLS